VPRIHYDPESETLHETKPSYSIDEDSGLPEPKSDYIVINYFGQKLHEHSFRFRHRLSDLEPTQPFFIGPYNRKNERNLFHTNMSWYKEIPINNRLPNWFVFHKIEKLGTPPPS